MRVGHNVRLENLLQQDKISPNATHLDAAITRLEAKATANGIPVLHPKKDPTGRAIGFGAHQMGHEVDLFDRYLPPNGALIYRFLCGHVHCLPWVTLAKGTAVPSGEPGISIAPMELDVHTFLACSHRLCACTKRTSSSWSLSPTTRATCGPRRRTAQCAERVRNTHPCSRSNPWASAAPRRDLRQSTKRAERF